MNACLYKQQVPPNWASTLGYRLLRSEGVDRLTAAAMTISGQLSDCISDPEITADLNKQSKPKRN
jgi:hypothetical protein